MQVFVKHFFAFIYISSQEVVISKIKKLNMTTDTVLKNGMKLCMVLWQEKDLEAACAGHKEKDEAATQREDQLRERVRTYVRQSMLLIVL